MFRALAHPHRAHREVRRVVVQHMGAHWEDRYRPFVEDGCAATYLRTMARDGTWGDQLALRAFSECYQTEVRVYRWKREGVLTLSHRMRASGVPMRGVQHVIYDGEHYDVGIPVNMAGCRGSL